MFYGIPRTVKQGQQTSNFSERFSDFYNTCISSSMQGKEELPHFRPQFEG